MATVALTPPRIHTLAPSRRLDPRLVFAGAIASLMVSVAMGCSMLGVVDPTGFFTKTAAASVVMSGGSSGESCRSNATGQTCSVFDNYGGSSRPLLPGESRVTHISLHNVGRTTVGSSTLVPGGCVAGASKAPGATPPPTSSRAPGNLCEALHLAVYAGPTLAAKRLYSGTVADFTAPVALGALRTDETRHFTFRISLRVDAATWTAVAGQTISQPLSWSSAL